MEKQYKKIEFPMSTTVADAVFELMTHAKHGEFVCGDFNGHMLYSDTVSMNSAYKAICGKTQYEFLRHEQLQHELYIEEERKHKEAIPALTKEWIDKGHEVLSPDKWDLWAKCVPIRLGDLYNGMELGCCLDIIKILNTGDFKKAKQKMESQNHSGMSWGLVKSMVRSFSDKGEEFCAILDY